MDCICGKTDQPLCPKDGGTLAVATPKPWRVQAVKCGSRHIAPFDAEGSYSVQHAIAASEGPPARRFKSPGDDRCSIPHNNAPEQSGGVVARWLLRQTRPWLPTSL